ncbi:hypothetical protein Tco_0079242 [Tanacetum coccineum]
MSGRFPREDLQASPFVWLVPVVLWNPAVFPVVLVFLSRSLHSAISLTESPERVAIPFVNVRSLWWEGGRKTSQNYVMSKEKGSWEGERIDGLLKNVHWTSPSAPDLHLLKHYTSRSILSPKGFRGGFAGENEEIEGRRIVRWLKTKQGRRNPPIYC